MSKLTPAQVRRALLTVPGWKRRGGEIWRKFTFAGFLPDIDIRWNQVKLALSTHSEGGLTAQDFASARHYTTLAGRHSG